MKALIIGASGLVGSNCLRHFSEQGWEVAGTYFGYPQPGLHYFNALEETPDPDKPGFDVVAFRPDVIVHCGALTHVDYCEQHPEESYTQTVATTLRIAGLAAQCGARLIYLSTDYVFDGQAGPYTEDAPVNPLSVYGRHKLEAEQAIAKTSGGLVLRVTNVYGDEARGKNFVARIIAQCVAGQKLSLKLPYDQYATPTNAADIARVLALLIADGHSGIWHAGSTDFMNRVALAQCVLKYFPEAGYDLEAISTADLKQTALRPLLGGLISAKFAAHYPAFQWSNVDDYLRQHVGSKR